MKSRFKAAVEPAGRVAPSHREADFNETESFDDSGAHFTTSLQSSASAGRFVAEKSSVPDSAHPLGEVLIANVEYSKFEYPKEDPQIQDQESRDHSWRQEVTTKLTDYKARRRPREPKYPSLQLKFPDREREDREREDREWARRDRSEFDRPLSDSQSAVEAQQQPRNETPSPTISGHPLRQTATQVAIQPPLFEATARIIKFPRSLYAPRLRVEELADPVFDRPRIIEAPESSPLLPSLGGISIESAEPAAAEKRPGFEMPLQSANMGRRMAATLIDATIVIASTALFAYIFWRLTGIVPDLRLSAETIGALALSMWSAYQYLLIVYCGTSPGLTLMKLQLNRFDGSTAPRKLRRWRVIASMLSGLSLALGYAWCFLDEDRLCWHDRITRTYMAPKKESV